MLSKHTITFNNLTIQLGIGKKSKDVMGKTDLHIHFPAGAVSKDGPSAGVTITTVLVSLFTERCVRSDTAMTGEITLRGLVLPVSYRYTDNKRIQISMCNHTLICLWQDL